MSYQPAQRFSGQEPGFNHAAANVIFERVMKMDEDEAQVYSAMVLGGALQDELIRHGRLVTKALDAHYAQRAEVMKKNLARSAVSKARNGQDNTAEIRALEEIVKAFGKDPRTRNEKGQFWHTEMRHLLSGATPVRHLTVDYTDAPNKPAPDKLARRLGLPATKLSGKDAARYQHAYAQIADMVAPFTGMAPGDAALHVRVKDRQSGRKRTEIVDLPARGEDLDLGLRAGERITAASLTVLPGVSASGAAYDALAALRQPGMGAVLANAIEHGAGSTERVKGFGNEWNRPSTDDNDAYRPSVRLFGRLAAGSSLLEDSLGDSAPRKLKLALALGQHVGTYGPEAQKVIGPHADRAAYRYRGTERAPDARLINGLESVRVAAELPSAQAKRAYLIHGQTDLEDNWHPSPTLQYFRRILPDADLNTLQRKSGAIPPSQGIILDRAGKVSTQSVGYGDDHYLPFNLAKLKALRGGEYIRTRTFGGPTTEDVYTGLISGARALTVVSHNGSYTMEFDPALRGSRRYNDKAAQMVARYGQLLDAVKNGEITTGSIDPSRLRELSQKAARVADPERNPERYQAEYDLLLRAEKKNPSLSKEQVNTATVEFFSQQAENSKTADGHVMNADEFVRQQVGRQALSHLRASDYFAKMPAQAQRQLLEQTTAKMLGALSDPDPATAGAQLADALGLRAKLDAHLERSAKDYQASLKPLKLDGPGYQLAMQALQEQFPYYIHDVKFHPWADASNRSDTGYVKPRHNRPEKALAGYFDPSVTGHGKVTADSTRFQNFPVRRGALRHYSPGGPKPAGAGAAAAGGGAVAAAGGLAGRDGEHSADTLKRMREDADLDLLTTLRNQSHFGTAVEGKGEFTALDQLRGLEITEALIQGLKPVAPALAGLLGMSDDQAMSTYAERPEVMRSNLKRAAAEVRTYGFFDNIDRALKSFENEGRPVQGVALGNTRLMLRNPNGEYDLKDAGAAYSEQEEPSVRQVSETYAEDGAISAAILKGHLPRSVSDPDFEAKAKTFAALLVDADQRYAAFDRGGKYPTGLGIEQAGIDPAAEALVKANQLRRRYKEAIGRETEVIAREASGAPAAPSGGTQVSVITADLLREALAGIPGMENYDPARILESGSGNQT